MTKILPARLKGTPLAIVEAAERLFGEFGIESVSLRQIRLEACAGNNSAISYHFNDRAKLVRAIWEWRLPELEKMRRALLDRMAEEGTLADPQAILRALILPNYELKDAAGMHRYASFFRHAIRWQQGAAIRQDALYLTPASSEAVALFHALRPDVPPDLLDYRLRHGCCMFFDMISERDAAIASGVAVEPEETFLNEGMAMLEALCLRPAL